MKSKTKVILVGEEHSDTSHMQPIAELVIKHLQNNKSVTIALEQNCGSRTMEDLFYVVKWDRVNTLAFRRTL